MRRIVIFMGNLRVCTMSVSSLYQVCISYAGLADIIHSNIWGLTEQRFTHLPVEIS